VKSGIFGVRDKCCGSLNLEHAGSWYSNMSALCRDSCCMIVMTSGLRFMFSWTICMGSISILFVPSGIGFHCCIVVPIVRIVILWYGCCCLHLSLLLCLLAGLARSARFTAGLLHPPIGCLCCVGPASLSSPLRFKTGQPGSYATRLPLQFGVVKTGIIVLRHLFCIPSIFLI